MFHKARSHDYYAARRERRAARWDRPIGGTRERLRAWLDLLFVDHGILRLFHLNAHQVGAHVWRMAQPAPHDIARFARQKGIKTIVNLRGGRSHGAWQLEREAAERHGIEVVELILRSREAPDTATLLSLPAFFEGLQTPVLVHCKSGADRAGLFAALYLLITQRADAATAMRELSLRTGHVRFAKAGILDAFLEAYRDEGERAGKAFLDWVREDYDAEKLAQTFKPRAISSFLVDRLLRRE